MSEPDHRIESEPGERPYSVPREVPVLPLRDTVLFPNSFMPLAVARESSVKLIDDAIANAKVIGVFTQKDPRQEDPGEADLHPVGTLTHIHKMFKLPDGSLRLIVQGLTRIRLDHVVSTRPYLRAEVTEVARRAVARPTRSRSTRSSATSARTSVRSSSCRRCCPRI